MQPDPVPPPGTARLGRVVARQASLREHNLAIVVDVIVRGTVARSRAEVAHHTGMTRTTVSALVEQLMAAGLIAELPQVRSGRAGRPAAPLVPASRTAVGVGLEINVDYLGLRALDFAGSTLAQELVPGDYRGRAPEEVLTRLLDCYRRQIGPLTDAGTAVAAVCLAIPGLVGAADGVLRSAPNLRWRDLRLADRLGDTPELAGLPVSVVNDATLAAQAEAHAERHSAGRSFLYVAGEIGIGGAVVIDGEVSWGLHGWSGEIGHVTVEPDGPPCSCGSTGCLEQYAGQEALLRAAGLEPAQPFEDFVRLADDGDAAVLDAVDRAGRALGIALSAAVNLVDVDSVVLAGIWLPLLDRLRPGIELELSRRVLSYPFSRVQVRAAQAMDHPALTGAALRCIARVLADPTGWIERTRS